MLSPVVSPPQTISKAKQLLVPFLDLSTLAKHRATCICSEGGSPNNKHAPGEESAHIYKILEMGGLSVKQ